jgi:hypothetical protein
MYQYFLTLINGGAPLCTSQRLKAKCDEALSNFASNFNLRRYSKVRVLSKAWRCTSTQLETRAESAWFLHLKLTYDKLLSRFAFKFKLRRYVREPKGREVDDGDVFAINDQFNEKLFRIKVWRWELADFGISPG